MNVQKKTDFDIDLSLNGDINIIKLSITLDKNRSENTKYLDLLTKFMTTYNQKYDNICSCYERSPILKSILSDELDVFAKLDNYTTRVKTLENEVLNLIHKINTLSDVKSYSNIDEIRSEVLFVFDKHTANKDLNNLIEKTQKSLHICNDVVDTTKLNATKDNNADIDYTLLDKISELIPECADILLKHVVKEINGSAKGLSDFVSLFQKYGKVIENYNQIVYFQRKGCHFVKRVKI